MYEWDDYWDEEQERWVDNLTLIGSKIIGFIETRTYNETNFTFIPLEDKWYELRFIVNVSEDSEPGNNIGYNGFRARKDGPDVNMWLEFENFIVNREDNITVTVKNEGTKPAENINITLYLVEYIEEAAEKEEEPEEAMGVLGEEIPIPSEPGGPTEPPPPEGSTSENLTLIGTKLVGYLNPNEKVDINFPYISDTVGSKVFKIIANLSNDTNPDNNYEYFGIDVLADQPDLNVWFQMNDFMLYGNDNNIQFGVNNNGGQSAYNIDLTLLENGTILHNEIIPEIISDRVYDSNYLWTPPKEGAYNITIKAEIDDDYDLENNVYSRDIIVARAINTTISITNSSGEFVSRSFYIMENEYQVNSPTRVEVPLTRIYAVMIHYLDGIDNIIGYEFVSTIFPNITNITTQEYYNKQEGSLRLPIISAVETNLDFEEIGYGFIFEDRSIFDYLDFNNVMPYYCTNWSFESDACLQEWNLVEDGEVEHTEQSLFSEGGVDFAEAFALGEVIEVTTPSDDTGGSPGGGGGSRGGGGGGSRLPSKINLNLRPEFNTAQGYTARQTQGDTATFTIAADEHLIELISLKADSITIKVGVISRIFNIKDQAEFDVNNDGIKDIFISLRAIVGGRAEIIYKKLAGPPKRVAEEEISIKEYEEVKEEVIETEKEDIIKGFAIRMGIILILVLLSTTIYYYRKRIGLEINRIKVLSPIPRAKPEASKYPSGIKEISKTLFDKVKKPTKKKKRPGKEKKKQNLQSRFNALLKETKKLIRKKDLDKAEKNYLKLEPLYEKINKSSSPDSIKVNDYNRLSKLYSKLSKLMEKDLKKEK